MVLRDSHWAVVFECPEKESGSFMVFAFLVCWFPFILFLFCCHIFLFLVTFFTSRSPVFPVLCFPRVHLSHISLISTAQFSVSLPAPHTLLSVPVPVPHSLCVPCVLNLFLVFFWFVLIFFSLLSFLFPVCSIVSIFSGFRHQLNACFFVLSPSCLCSTGVKFPLCKT